MITSNDKQEIIGTIDMLNGQQVEQVLQYIKALLSPDKTAEHQHSFKKQAMLEIREALSREPVETASKLEQFL